MKKCIVCAVLLCLILGACASIVQSPTTTTTLQMNGTTTSTVLTKSTTSSIATTVPTTNSSVTTAVPTTTAPTTVTTTVPTTSCTPTTVVTTTKPAFSTTKPIVSVYVPTTKPTGTSTPGPICVLPAWRVLRGYDAYREYLSTNPENTNSYWLYYYENLPYIGEINYVQMHPWERSTMYMLDLRVDGNVSVSIGNAGVITCYGTEYTGTGEDLRTVDAQGSVYRIVGAFVYRYRNGELSAVAWVYNECQFTLNIDGNLAPENLHPFMNDLLNTKTVDRAWQAVVTAAEKEVK